MVHPQHMHRHCKSPDLLSLLASRRLAKTIVSRVPSSPNLHLYHIMHLVHHQMYIHVLMVLLYDVTNLHVRDQDQP